MTASAPSALPIRTPPKHFGADEFAAFFDVSRETMAKLTLYEQILRQWQAKVNLVSQATLADFWWRHAGDSAQLLRLAPPASRTAPHKAPRKPQIWLDIGSGAGFPALIVALLLGQSGFVHLVESNRRKADFLEAVIRQTGARARVHCQWSEDLARAHCPELAGELAGIDIITARACAPLPKLLGFIAPFFNPSAVALLHKGKSWQAELTRAQKDWDITYEAHPSQFARQFNDAGRVLRITALAARSANRPNPLL